MLQDNLKHLFSQKDIMQHKNNKKMQDGNRIIMNK